jgi:hypothetical protein
LKVYFFQGIGNNLAAAHDPKTADIFKVQQHLVAIGLEC